VLTVLVSILLHRVLNSEKRRWNVILAVIVMLLACIERLLWLSIDPYGMYFTSDYGLAIAWYNLAVALMTSTFLLMLLVWVQVIMQKGILLNNQRRMRLVRLAYIIGCFILCGISLTFPVFFPLLVWYAIIGVILLIHAIGIGIYGILLIRKIKTDSAAAGKSNVSSDLIRKLTLFILSTCLAVLVLCVVLGSVAPILDQYNVNLFELAYRIIEGVFLSISLAFFWVSRTANDSSSKRTSMKSSKEEKASSRAITTTKSTSNFTEESSIGQSNPPTSETLAPDTTPVAVNIEPSSP